MLKRLWHRLVETLRRDFVAGLLVFVPVGSTVLGVLWLVDQLDNMVLPRFYRALGMEIEQPRLVGVLATLCVILLAGALTRSFLGRSALLLWERVVDRIPVARSLYSVLKQFMQAVLGQPEGGASFDRVVVIQYPRQGIYTYAFVTGRSRYANPGIPDDLVKVFVPSTPNPTTGYLLLLPEQDLIETDLSIETAFSLIVSGGIAEVVNDRTVRIPGAAGDAKAASPPARTGSPESS